MSEPQEEPGMALGRGVKVTGKQNKRLRQSVVDMVISMAVVLGVVAVVLLLVWRPQPDPVKVVDPQPYISVAAEEAPFAVTAPEGLADGWRPTSARWEPTGESNGMPVLRVGYVTPAGEYAQLSELAFPADADPAQLSVVREQAQGLYPEDQRQVAGQQWLSAEFDGKRMLARVWQGGITIVSGTAGWPELEALARSLQPVAG